MARKSEVGTLYRTTGVIETVQPHSAKSFTLDELQGFVGGNIELIPGTGRAHHPSAYCNEEGRLDGLPVNAKASEKFGMELMGDVIEVRKL